MGPRPPEPEFFVDTAWKAGGTKAKKPAPAHTGVNRDTMILQALLSYTGPVNKKGRPKLRPLREHANLPDLTRAERNRMYEQR